MIPTLYQERDYQIGSALRRLRRRAKLTQEQVAAQLQIRELNVSRDIYGKMETGDHGIKISVLVALKEIFHAEYADFFADLP